MCDGTAPITEDFFDVWFDNDERGNACHCLLYRDEDPLATRHAKGCMLELSAFFKNLLSEFSGFSGIDIIILQISFAFFGGSWMV